MKDPYEHIHMATNERLAEYLTEPIPTSQEEWYEILHEAAARLRKMQSILDSKIKFNSEQFDV